MKCFTVDNFDAMDGIRVARTMRPHLITGSCDQMLLGPELTAHMRECLLDPEKWTGDDLRYDKVFADIFLHQASLVIDNDWGHCFVPETDDDSRKRALVLFQADLQHTGIDLSGRVEFGTYPNVEISMKVAHTLVADRQRKSSGDPYDESVRRRTTLVIMQAGDYLETSVSWFKIDARRHWVPAERPPRTIERVSFDGTILTIEDLYILRGREREVLQRW